MTATTKQMIRIRRSITLTSADLADFDITYDGYLGKTRGVQTTPIEFDYATITYEYYNGTWNTGHIRAYWHRIKKDGTPYNERHEWGGWSKDWPKVLDRFRPDTTFELTEVEGGYGTGRWKVDL